MKQIFSTVVLCLIFWGATAQEVYNSSGRPGGYKKKEIKGYDPDKLIIGGGINLGYSGDFANIGLSPKVGYKLNNFLAVGVGLGYQYYKAPDLLYNNKQYYIRENIVYPSIWAKCTVYNPIYIAADIEYNVVMVQYHDFDYYQPNQPLVLKNLTKGIPATLVGVGFKQPIGGRTSATFEVMYDLLQADDYSPYQKTLVYRAGIFVGL